MRRVTLLAAGAAFLTFPFTVEAQDFTPDASRILSDPNYLPLAGQIYGFTSYNHNWTNGDSFNYLGTETSTFHVDTDTLAQFLSYGITDDLELNATIHYEPDTTRKIDFASGTEAQLNSSGFSDPSFGAVWRALDQGPYPANFDIFGSFSPDLFSSKAASPNQDGTVARGGDSGILGAALGYETRQFSLRGAFNATFNGDSQSLDLGTGDLVHTQGHTDYTVSLATQTRLTPVFSVNASIDHTFAASQNDLNEATGIAHVTRPGDTTAVHASLNYHLVPNKAVIAATYTHNFLGNSHSDYLDPTSNTSTRNRAGDAVGVELYYVLP